LTDIPANTATTASISVGGSVTDVLETPGDHDWFKITLTAGQSITISLAGTGANPVTDTYLNLRNSSGTIIAHNDDSGGTLFSKIVFTPTTSGTYYIDAGAWDITSQPVPATSNTITGTYTLSVQPYTPPPVATLDQIADQLVNGYWSAQQTSAHHFNVTQGGSITVNYSTLTAAEQTLAIAALGEWSDIIGVRFTPVTSGGQIVFDDSEDPTANGPVAATDGHWSGGIISSEHVQISASWVNQYGSSLNSYSFQTYIHEIGHALGLGHAGDYNNTADYAADALFRNDSWATSIMSYFSESDNSYVSQQGFTEQFALTPMGADIVAMQQIYGLSTTTRTGNTIYGFNSNAGSNIFNASAIPNAGYTIFDSGGNDTLDYSGYSSNQLINLNPETFSNVGHGVGNVSIARGTIIENAIGGSGNDNIIANNAGDHMTGNAGNDTLTGGTGDDFLTGGSGADTLTGGAGNDTFSDTMSNFVNDTITDFGAGDKIVFSDAALSTFTFNLSGTTLTYNGLSLKLGSAPTGGFVANAAAGGGVQLTAMITHHAANDFNGDGHSDIMWRDSSGMLSEWLGQPNGGFLWNASSGFQVGTDWSIKGFGDFNGDGRDDILWGQDSTGTVMEWLAQSNGGFAWNVNYNLPTGSQYAGIGDFNGDGRDDVIWRDSSGALSEWLGQTNGGFQWNPFGSFQVGTDWSVAGTGDFNGDGRGDLLWRQDSTGKVMEWLGQTSGGFAWNVSYDLSTTFHVAGIADFNGDGLSDILWRDSNGMLSEWLGQPGGGFQWNQNASFQVSNTSQVVGTGDYNGDGRDDILWQTDTGHVYEWLAQPNGGFVWNQPVQYDVSTNSHVQPVADHFL
jgi:Ca2+-binding RTX toxin-like protein